MSNPNVQPSPALRIEAVSINCIMVVSHTNSDKCNLLIIAESLPAHYYEYLFLMRIIILMHIIRRTPRGNNHANHKHAVTAVSSPNTGTFHYSYDEAGNMISRNGDTMSYNSQGKLKQIDTEGGDKLEYLYDSTGNRIKRKMKASGVVVYNFDGLYEIARTPGEGEKHTLYFKGLYGDIFSQMTRNDASLVAGSDLTPTSSFLSSLLDVVPSPLRMQWRGGNMNKSSLTKSWGEVFCQDISGSCSTYYLNTAKFYWITGAYRVMGVINTVEYDVFMWLLLVVVLYVVSSSGSRTTSGKHSFILSASRLRSITGFFITPFTNNEPWFAKRTLFATPLLTVAVLFTFTNCGMFSSGGKSGEAPWLLLVGGINGNTASVDDASNGAGSSGGSGSGGSALVPVVGMYFLHPDHLGSITMITDGRGNVISGGNNGGKSHISYTPYGSIHRTDSSGPDISRFKFTGQEEDKESGLLYYKARYYDPMVGRFLQADNLYEPDDIQGMNHYMYVNGNPMKFRDNTGNSCTANYTSAIIGTLLFPVLGPFGYAFGGVAPGQNYTGNGSCSRKEPQREMALAFLFGLFTEGKPVSQEGFLTTAFAIYAYVQHQESLGQATFLDGLNTNRKQYTGLLIGLVATGQVSQMDAVLVYLLMTDGVAKPKNGVDRASYKHDYSDGSSPVAHKARNANNTWVKNSWANARTPYDFVMAATGTALFKTANAIIGVTHVPYKNYKPGWKNAPCRKGCTMGSF